MEALSRRSGPASGSMLDGSGVGQATGSLALGKAECWFQSPAAGLGQPHTLHLEVCQVLAAVQWGGSLYPWFNSRFELQANAKCRPCSSVQILRCPLPPQVIQLPHGHSNLSCINSLEGGSPFCKGLLLLIWGFTEGQGTVNGDNSEIHSTTKCQRQAPLTA